MDANEIKPGVYRVTHRRLWWEGKAVNAEDAKKQATKRFKERESNGKESSSERQAS